MGCARMRPRRSYSERAVRGSRPCAGRLHARPLPRVLLARPDRDVVTDPRAHQALDVRISVIVIPKAGQAVSLPELTRFLTDAGLARFKLPERVELVSEFPLS